MCNKPKSLVMDIDKFAFLDVLGVVDPPGGDVPGLTLVQRNRSGSGPDGKPASLVRNERHVSTEDALAPTGCAAHFPSVATPEQLPPINGSINSPAHRSRADVKRVDRELRVLA